MEFKNIHILMLCLVAFFAMAGGALGNPRTEYSTDYVCVYVLNSGLHPHHRTFY